MYIFVDHEAHSCLSNSGVDDGMNSLSLRSDVVCWAVMKLPVLLSCCVMITLQKDHHRICECIIVIPNDVYLSNDVHHVKSRRESNQFMLVVGSNHVMSVVRRLRQNSRRTFVLPPPVLEYY